ncbi:hypothetical protein [uncultured Acetatifactor sp.]|jgi:hypothetical protein|uniref:hypothetical protein n=1 Tax=uncultured Acetatifactor sp. TaxID=1671927 RepID=UPI0026017A42|nr:hypothetical protein [uncultured Acetatifactor sp.]
MMGRKRGRPAASGHVNVTPEFRPEPDIEKLGRALIAIAVSIAEAKKKESAGDADAAQAPLSSTKIRTYSAGKKGDGMT